MDSDLCPKCGKAFLVDEHWVTEERVWRRCPACRHGEEKLMCHEHGHDHRPHTHEHHHHGDAGHGHPSSAELTVIEETIQKINEDQNSPQYDLALKVLVKNIHKIYSPVDLYDHNEKFKKALNSIGIYLKWGRKASHTFKHAYVLNYSNEEGGVYTIQTDHDLDKVDNSSASWASVDLFREDA